MTSSTTDLTFSVLNTWSSLSSLQVFWERWCQHPNAEYRLFTETLRNRKEVIRPHVLVIKSGEEAKAAVLCRIEDLKCSVAIGYLKIGTITVRTLVVMHGGVLGELDPTAAEEVIRYLSEALRQGAASRILFSPIAESSPLAAAALRLSTEWNRGFILRRSKHWWIDIPPTPGMVLAGMKSKHRHYLKKMQRSLDERFSESVVYKKFNYPQDVSQALGEIETVACKTYQRGLGVGIVNNDEYANRLKALAEAGHLRVWVLYAGGKPRAFRVGTICGDTIHGLGTGYDPEFSDYRVGTLLLLNAIDDLSTEGIQRYDLGLGDADYKQRFGSSYCDEVSFSVFGNSARAQLAKVAIVIPLHISRILTDLLVRFKAADRVKKVLRGRAGSAAAKAAPPA